MNGSNHESGTHKSAEKSDLNIGWVFLANYSKSVIIYDNQLQALEVYRFNKHIEWFGLQISGHRDDKNKGGWAHKNEISK